MPIVELQRRARELGRIRIGQKVTGSDGRARQAKLDRFRITSHSRPLLDKVAALYGGEVHDWQPAGGPPQFEVITDAKRLPVLVPPQPVSQWLETWSAGGCVHRCDGVTDAFTGAPCDRGPDHEAAKPTTRLNVILRDVAAVGVFRLESHGWNAAAELPDVAAFLAHAGGYVDGWLALQERVTKSAGQTRRFIVPTIEIDVTPAQLLAGRQRAELELEQPGQKAIEAAPAPAYVDPATGELACNHPLTTPKQQERGICNRCWQESQT
jgi:Recombination directionality factor-like